MSPRKHPRGSESGIASPKNYLADFRAAARVAWPANRTLTVVCFGHSVPSGYFATPQVRSLDAYPHLLRVALAERYPQAVINVIVSAIGGENAEQGSARFAAEVVPLRPDVVTIDYALNDRWIGLERTRAAWTTLIKRTLAMKAKVILLTPTADTAARFKAKDEPLNLHAAQIRELSATYAVGLCDSWKATKRELARGVPLASLMSQENHPNRAGHEIVARELAKWFV